MNKKLTLNDVIEIGENARHNIILERWCGKEGSIRVLNEMYNYKSIEDRLELDLETIYQCAVDGFYEVIPEHKLNSSDKVCSRSYSFRYGKYVDFKNKKLQGMWYNDLDETYYMKEYKFEDYGKTWARTIEELEKK